MKQARLFIIFVLILSLTLVVSAQSDDTYTFPSGVRFEVPAGAVLGGENLPELSFGDTMVVEMVDPAFIGVTAEETVDAPLPEVLEYLLGLLGHTDFIPGNQFSEKLADGREVLGYVFTNESSIVQTVVVVRLSDGSVGAINIRSLAALNAAEQAMMRSLALTFDVADAGVDLASTLPQSFSYADSGTTFRFPERYALDRVDDPPVVIGFGEDIYITMVDPYFVGIPADATMAEVQDFAVEDTPLAGVAFEPFDIGAREALIGEAATEDNIYHSMVLIRFSDGTVGIMDVFTYGPLADELRDEVRAIASSFDSASSEFTGVSSLDADAARALFESGMDLYDAGDFTGAFDLLDEATSLDPTFTLAIYWRGATYQHLGELEAALADYEAALASAPAERQILTDIAEVQALLDRVDEAAASLQAFVDDPGTAEVSASDRDVLAMYQKVASGQYDGDFYYGRASQLRALGLHAMALQDTQMLLDNEPTFSTGYALHGGTLIDLDREQEAVTVLTKGLRVEETSLLYLFRGFAYQNLMMSDFSAMIDAAHDFQCVLLIADDTVTAQQLEDAERALTRMIISSDDYEEYTDVAQCVG